MISMGLRMESRELLQPMLTWVAVYVEPVHSPFTRQPNCLQAATRTKAQCRLIAQLIDPHQRSQSCACQERETPHHHHDISPRFTAGLSRQVSGETNSHTEGSCLQKDQRQTVTSKRHGTHFLSINHQVRGLQLDLKGCGH